MEIARSGDYWVVFGKERMKATMAFMSRVFMLVRGMPPFCMDLLWWRRRSSRVWVGRINAVPDKPGAATVPLRPPMPWHVSQLFRWKMARPCWASGVSAKALSCSVAARVTSAL